MRRAWLLVLSAGLVVACGKALTIASDDAATDGPRGDASSDALVVGDGGLPGAPCPSSGPCLLVANAAHAASIAVQGVYVYYAQYENVGAVWGVPSAGGAAAVVVSAQKLPSSLFATAEALYWVNEGTNEVARRPGAPPSPIATFSSGASMAGGQVAAFATIAFWTSPGGAGTGDAGEVHYSTAFPSDQPIQTGLDRPMAIAVDATYVYFAASTVAGKEQIFRSPHAGGAREMTPQSHQGIHALAVSATGAVALAAADFVGQSPSFAAPFVSAGVASPSSLGVGVVIDEVRGTYFLMSDGTLHYAASGTPDRVATKVAGCPNGRGLAQDATYLYLACESSIWRVPK